MKRAQYFVFIVFIWLLTSGLSAQEAVRVACIGDSITAGAGASDRKERAYPTILGQLLGEGYDVRNFGLGGRTLMKSGNRPYSEEGFFQKSQEFEPDIVVIKLGTNDSKPMNWDDHAVEFEGDLREFVRVYKNLPSEPKIYLCYPTWVVNDDMTIRESILVQYIIPAIYKVAKELNVSVIDLHTTLYGMPHLIPDGVHPNDLGYVLLAKEVYDRIK